jgi:hypothetical protein
MLTAQCQGKLKPWSDGPCVLGVKANSASIHWGRDMKRAVLNILGCVAIEEVIQSRHHFGGYKLRGIIVSDVVPAEVRSHFESVPANRLREIVQELVLRYISPLWKRHIGGIESVYWNIRLKVEGVRERRGRAVGVFDKGRPIVADGGYELVGRRTAKCVSPV